MIKDIRYTGISTRGADYDAQDGTLVTATNIIPTTEGFRTPALPANVTDISGEQEEKVIYLHKAPGFSHYIIQTYSKETSSYSLSYMLEEGNHKRIPISGMTFSDEVSDITSVNNTLVISTYGRHLVYIYFKPGKGYVVLDKIPELPIRFSLDSRIEKEAPFIVHLSRSGEKEKQKVVLADGEETMVLGNVNKFIADYSVNRGRFIFPFLVRYAYRMYDDTLIMHSAPVLMVTSDLAAPCICGDDYVVGGEVKLNVSAATHTLFYQCISQADLRALDVWSDIIKSVDVFITKPIYTYDQNGSVVVAQNADEAKTPFAMKSISVSRIDEDGIIEKNNLRLLDGCNYIQPRTYRDMYVLTYRDISQPGDIGGRPYDDLMADLQEVLKVPSRQREDVIKDIKDAGLFYLLKSIPVSKLSLSRTKVEFPDSYLQSLVAREVMTDDFDSHCTLIPQSMFSYNNRLNIANIEKQFYNGYDAASALEQTDGYAHISVDNDGKVYKYVKGAQERHVNIRVFIFLKKEGRDVIMESPGDVYNFGYSNPIFYYYYPDPDAYKAVVCFYVDGEEKPRLLTLDMKSHDFLNGAVFCDTPGLERDFFYYYDTLTNAPLTESGMTSEAFHAKEFDNWITRAVTNGNLPDMSMPPAVTTDNKAYLPNKLYTSGPNNPFSFPYININSVGSGKILGLAAATRALSEGQVGDFPLYAFTSEGIWALTVNPDTGTYVSVQSIASDVCINGRSIVSTDRAVLFYTSRGLMLLSGAQTTCLSETLKEPSNFKWNLNPAINALLKSQGDYLPTFVAKGDFSEYIEGADVIYDYKWRRVYLFNKRYQYAYVYDVETEAWGSLSKSIQYGINTFPEAVAVVRDSEGQHLVNFSKCEHATAKVFLVTRPLKLDAVDTFKTVRTVVQRGYLAESRLAIVLLASNDLANWYCVGSSVNGNIRNISGTPYKYYIVGVAGTLNRDNSIRGCDMEFVLKLTNKLR